MTDHPALTVARTASSTFPVGGLTILSFLLILLVLGRLADAAVSDRIVAIVNGDTITLSELEERAQPVLERYAAGRTDDDLAGEKREEILNRVLSQLIDDRLVDREVRRLSIRVDDKEVDSALNRICEESGLTLDQLKAKLAEEDTSLEHFRGGVRREIERGRLIDAQIRAKIVVTDEQIRAYLDEHPSEDVAPGTRYVLQHICVTPRDTKDPSAVAAARTRAEEAWKALQAGQDFAATARRYSDSLTAREGGHLGDFALEDLAPYVRDVVKGLDQGRYSAVVDTPVGWQIFRVKEVLQGAAAREMALRERIRQRLYQTEIEARFEEWLRGLRAKSAIRILL